MIEITTNKQTRGYILKVCKLNYPQPIGSNVINVCLIDAGMGSGAMLDGHLKYLADRGYVKLKSAGLSVLGTSISLVDLTAKGIDLLEGTIDDAGVDV